MLCNFCAALVAATQDDVGAALLAGACTHVLPHNPCRTQCVCLYVCAAVVFFSLFQYFVLSARPRGRQSFLL